jgi:hypothetical protein
MYVYVSAILVPFLGGLWKKKIHGYSIQDGAAAHTAICYFNVLYEVLQERMISQRPWPARSPDLNPCDCYLRENLRQRQRNLTIFKVNKH